HVDAPLVEPEVHAPEAAHRVDDEQRVAAGRIDGRPDRGDVVADAGRGLVVHHQHRTVAAVAQRAIDVLRGARAAPYRMVMVDLQAVIACVSGVTHTAVG